MNLLVAYSDDDDEEEEVPKSSEAKVATISALPAGGDVKRKKDDKGKSSKSGEKEKKRKQQTKTDKPVQESRPVPEGYVCNACHVRGHWIQSCPKVVAEREARAKTEPETSGSESKRAHISLPSADDLLRAAETEIPSYLKAAYDAEIADFEHQRLAGVNLPESRPDNIHTEEMTKKLESQEAQRRRDDKIAKATAARKLQRAGKDVDTYMCPIYRTPREKVAPNPADKFGPEQGLFPWHRGLTDFAIQPD